MNKEVTIGQFIDAIEKNGIRQAFNSMWRNETATPIASYNHSLSSINSNPEKDSNKIVSACALGQGLINLGVESIEWNNDGTYNKFVEPLWKTFFSRVIRYNDVDTLSLPAVARNLRIDFKHILDEKMMFPIFDYSPYLEGE